jgi:lysophospholipase L1-like esterase
MGGAISALALKPLVFGATKYALSSRPLRMLALGDSVMWGQGLDEKNKFTYKLSDWLCKQRNNGSCLNQDDVQLHVEAHSGAIISKEDDTDAQKEDKRFTRPTAPLKYLGEVNNHFPTIRAQVELAQRYYTANAIPLTDVDLILVNGGINDMNASRLLAFKLIGGNVPSKAKEFCEMQMTSLLKSVAKTFPSARIVVPGYLVLLRELF